jgi:hypothetical protein
MIAWSSCAPRLPAKIIPILAGERRTRSAVRADEACERSIARYLGRAPVTAARYFGTASITITPATTRAAVRTSRGNPSDEDESLADVPQLSDGSGVVLRGRWGGPIA